MFEEVMMTPLVGWLGVALVLVIICTRFYPPFFLSQCLLYPQHLNLEKRPRVSNTAPSAWRAADTKTDSRSDLQVAVHEVGLQQRRVLALTDQYCTHDPTELHVGTPAA